MSVAILLFTRSAGAEATYNQFMSHGGRAANAAVVAQLIAHAAAAQVDLVMSLQDNAHKLVVGQAVHLDNAAIGFSAEQATNAQGKARSRGLSTAGRYAVSTVVSSDKFQSVREAGLVLRANSSPSVTLGLPAMST